MTDEVSLQWTPRHGPPRKLVFEPQPNKEYPWARIELEHCDSQWREVGIEYLTELTVTTNDNPETDRHHSQLTGGEVDE
ncbi:hypothetical protein [Natronorubrum aibiense]|uniref:Uncharacterized protein n=1 Tax=Natronorubrum aibiense TaxID=348826 RepID=A0A5P9P2E3_9EURY|nr:hypothetical protein [Natronorubrum aibiense]QFU82302.1 hypothetical protein GCU68_07055 [Natronorubrum aibiense]